MKRRWSPFPRPACADTPATRLTGTQAHGNSKIVHPDGNVLEEAGFFEERLVTATIDLAAATRSIAERAVEDETLLRDWMRQGRELVEVVEG